MSIGSAIGDFFSSGMLKPILDKFIPDAAQRDQFKLELQEAAYKQFQNQVDINKIEAGSSSMFVAGWRPAIGWTCAASLFVYYVPRAIMVEGMWVWACYKAGVIVPFPDMGLSDLLGLTGSMLGLSWMRTDEKKAGVARAQ